MCKISDYPALYTKAEELLRLEGIKSEIPGYEFLKRAIVICKVESHKKKMTEEDIIAEIEKTGIVVPSTEVNFDNKRDNSLIRQWIIEAIRSVESTDSKESMMVFIEDMALKL